MVDLDQKHLLQNWGGRQVYRGSQMYNGSFNSSWRVGLCCVTAKNANEARREQSSSQLGLTSDFQPMKRMSLEQRPGFSQKRGWVGTRYGQVSSLGSRIRCMWLGEGGATGIWGDNCRWHIVIIWMPTMLSKMLPVSNCLPLSQQLLRNRSKGESALLSGTVSNNVSKLFAEQILLDSRAILLSVMVCPVSQPNTLDESLVPWVSDCIWRQGLWRIN